MKKLILTGGVIAALAGSQVGFAACVGPADTCDSTVTLNVANLVVLKGLDDYDFSNPAVNGWNGTTSGKATILGDVCVGTNNISNGVDITFSSASGSFSVQGSGASDVPYTVYFNGNAIPSTGGVVDVTNTGLLQSLTCANETFSLNVEFAGDALLAATSGAAYTDTITVSVAPN